MSTITDIHNPWRDALKPASFRGAYFHVEAGSKDNGRRIVMHEYPKKEFCYAEDMGRRAKSFTVRAYCIQFPFDVGEFIPGSGNGPLSLYQRDYRVPRDILLGELEVIGPGRLQLPLLPAEMVVVNRYRMTEEERFGGYCVFDIDFSEFGVPPQYLTNSINTAAVLAGAADVMRKQAAAGAAGPPGRAPVIPGTLVPPGTVRT